MQRQRVPAVVAATTVRDVARALAYRHRQGIIHGDVNPANMVVRPSGQAVLGPSP